MGDFDKELDSIQQAKNDVGDFDKELDSLQQAKNTPSTYSYSSPDLYEDLKRNVGEVGYSGLDPSQQKLFQDQFVASKFARAGGSFEDAVKYVDGQAQGYSDIYEQQSEADKNLANERAREYGDAGGSFYSLAHNILQVPIGAAMSGLEYGKDKLFNEGDPNKPFYDYFKESQLPDAASNTLSDPSNFVGGGIKKWTTGAGFGGAQSGYEALERNPNASFNEVAVPTMIGAALGAGNVAVMTSPSRFVDKRASDLAENIASKEALLAERNAIIKEGIARSPYTGSRQSMQIGDEIEAMTHGFDPQAAKYMAELKAGTRLAEGLKVVEVFGSKLDRNMELMKKMDEIGNAIERRQFMKLPAISNHAKMIPVVGAPISRFVDNTAAPIVSDILTSPLSTKAALPAIQGVGFGLGKELTSREKK